MTRSASSKLNSTVEFKGRFVVLMLAMLVMALVLIGKAFVLHVEQREALLEQGDNRYTRVMTLNANRGNILDRYGKTLAASAPVISVWADPKEMLSILESNKNKKDELERKLSQGLSEQFTVKERERIDNLPTSMHELARVLNMNKNKLEQRIARYKNNRFVYLRRHLAPEMEQTIKALKFPAVYAQGEYRRYYPATEVAAPLVGFTNIDDHGQEGIEYAYEKVLASKNGKRRIIKDLTGAVVEDLALLEPAQPGRDIRLSLDLRLQYMTYRALGEALKTHDAAKGMATVLDVDTGEVLAMVSLPAFNPNERSRGNAALRRNRAAIDVFEPGSTVKPFVMAAAIEHGLVQQHEEIETSPGYVVVGEKTIKDHRDYGVLTPEYIIAKSSNVGMTKIMERIDDEVLFDVFNRLGFGTHLSTGFPGEQAGELPRPPYSKIQKAIMSYGYGVSVTSLQLAQAYSVLAAKGVSRPVSLIKVDEIPDGERVMSEQTANAVLGMMKTVVTDGTAKKAKIKGYSVAGKTGTAHKLVKGQYADDKYVSSFVGVAPANDPKYVMAVVIDNPQGKHYFGGSVAAPVFASVMESLLPLTGVRPQQATGYIAHKEDGGRDGA